MADLVRKLASSSSNDFSMMSSEGLGHSSQAVDPSTLPSSSTGNLDLSDQNIMDSEMDCMSVSDGRKKKFKDSKHCLVCGDKALGYNFNAVTCESCKAFFRRNALKDQQLKCLFQGNCNIDVRTRRFCPFCRLRKCYDIGMKKEMILDEKERKARMQKVNENRIRRKGKRSPEHVQSYVKQEPVTEPSSLMPCVAADSAGMSTGTGSMVTSVQDTFGNVDECPLEIPIEPHNLPQDPAMYRQLSEHDKKIMNDIIVAYRETVSNFASESHVNQEDSYSNINDIVNNSEIAVRRLIKFVKMMEDFKLLSQENQIATLKSCVLKTLLLRSANFYDIENDGWKTPTGLIPSRVLKQATGYGDLHDAHTKYCRSLKTLSAGDEYVMSLLHMIVLFNPEGQNITYRSFVSDFQDKYVLLLKHYLESRFSYLHSQRIFACLLKKLSELKNLSEDHARILLQVNSNQIEPLMLEVLNLH